MSEWNPRDFQTVVRIITTSPPMARGELVRMIHVMGPLPCPSPPWDPHTRYQVARDDRGALQLQKLQPDGRTWESAPYGPPTPTAPISRTFAEAEMWIDQHATVTREPFADGRTKVVLRSRKHPGLSREGYITPPEQPSDFPNLVLDLVAELKEAGG